MNPERILPFRDVNTKPEYTGSSVKWNTWFHWRIQVTPSQAKGWLTDMKDLLPAAAERMV